MSQRVQKVKLYPEPSIVFYRSSEGVVTYNALRNEEYRLNPEYYERLLFWDGENEDYLNSIDEDLIEGNLVLEEKSEDPNWNGEPVSYLFHLATRNHESFTPALSEESVLKGFADLSKSKGDPINRYQSPRVISMISLPKPSELDFQKVSFWDTVRKRKTTRNFDGTAVSLEDLSSLLYLTFGYIHGQQWNELQDLGVNFSSERKSSPSVSGLQSCEAYIAVTNVTGLESGFYRYHPEEHSLSLLSEGGDDDMLSYLVCDQFWVKGAAFAIFITADMERIWHKSTLPRTYPYAYLEAGHISQTALLGAVALNLKSWLTATFRDKFLAEKLQVDGNRCFPVSCVYIGNGTDEAIPLKFQEMAMNKRKSQ